ncbi:MAG: site-specific DNA-methyltransferase [Candidatus Levyibacteriota bacterium]
MPSFNWIGKDKVENHDNELPFRVLKPNKSLSVGTDQNLLIEGDNLEALKALMPFYYNKIKCIYIDPPYNTGNEKWVYNDKVNSPQIKAWLNKVVGAEGEDLCRHDKWLCMMYPRLKLLRELLNDDGIIFISINDNEVTNLRNICDEIFGISNFVAQITWKNKYGPGAMTKGFGNINEFILCYSKTPLKSIEAPLSDEEIKKYKNKDEKFHIRGGFITQPLATLSKDDRPNLTYTIYHNGEAIMPNKQWIWEKNRMETAIRNNEVIFRKSDDGKWSVRFKQYLKDENGKIRMAKPLSILLGPYNQDGTNEIRNIFGNVAFNNPKPSQLIKYLFSMKINGTDSFEGIFLDSFAGSGTTGQAVMELNKEDGGNRKYILVELEREIAKDITTKRLKKVIEGYDGAKFPDGTGQGFQYLDLNGELFDSNGFINKSATYEDMGSYIYFTETHNYLDLQSISNPFIGSFGSNNYFLLFDNKGKNVLDEKTVGSMLKLDGTKVIYADKCLLDEEFCQKNNIIFKQIPYEMKQF